MPLVEAMLAAGHTLQLVMRPPAADLARELFPECDLIVLAKDPFHFETKKQRRPFRREADLISRFDPDLYVACAFQLNFFDEAVLGELRHLSCAGFTTDDGFWPSDTSVDPRELSARFVPAVSVPTCMPEGEKNRHLAGALGGTVVESASGRCPTAASLANARRILEDHGLHEGEFTVVCAGARPGLAMKDWGETNWAELFREIGKSEDASFLFLGNPKESASVARLCEALPRGVRCINLAADPPPVAVSYALICLARAYLGRDSGLMHLAALAGIPLVAVFAGGHWPRFLPETGRGIVLTRQTPCRGCNFYCPFPEPWCIKTVPVADVVQAWRELPETANLCVAELAADASWLALSREMDAPSYAREQATAARAACSELVKGRAWQKMVSGLISR
jgi:hypothetical protein